VEYRSQAEQCANGYRDSRICPYGLPQSAENPLGFVRQEVHQYNQ